MIVKCQNRQIYSLTRCFDPLHAHVNILTSGSHDKVNRVFIAPALCHLKRGDISASRDHFYHKEHPPEVLMCCSLSLHWFLAKWKHMETGIKYLKYKEPWNETSCCISISPIYSFLISARERERCTQGPWCLICKMHVLWNALPCRNYRIQPQHKLDMGECGDSNWEGKKREEIAELGKGEGEMKRECKWYRV